MIHLDMNMDKALLFDINHNEYGLSAPSDSKKRSNTNSIYFQPSEFGILDKYSLIKELYKLQLSPTVITLTSHIETNQVSFQLGDSLLTISFFYSKSLKKAL